MNRDPADVLRNVSQRVADALGPHRAAPAEADARIVSEWTERGDEDGHVILRRGDDKAFDILPDEEGAGGMPQDRFARQGFEELPAAAAEASGTAGGGKNDRERFHRLPVTARH